MQIFCMTIKRQLHETKFRVQLYTFKKDKFLKNAMYAIWSKNGDKAKICKYFV